MESMVLLFVATLFTFISLREGWFEEVDLLIYDAVVSRSGAPVDERISLVRIDEASLFKYGAWPWPRELQARLLQGINRYKPDTVVLDIIYSAAAPGDEQLVRTAAETKHLALPMMVDFLARLEQHIEVTPFPDLYAQADKVGHIHVEYDNDAVVRGTYLFQGTPDPAWPHLMLALAHPAPRHEDYDCRPNTLQQIMFMQKCGYVRIPFAGPARTYDGISAMRLLDANSDAEDPELRNALTDRVVLVGLTAAGIDQVATPTTTENTTMSGVEFNANLLSAIRYGTLIDEAPWLVQFLICAAIVSLSTLLLPRMRPTQMLLTTFGLALIPVLFSVLLLATMSFYLPLITATIAVICIYPIWSWRRHEIAWQFIAAEVERIDAEQETWRGYGNRSTSGSATAIQSLSELLGQSLTTEPDQDARVNPTQPLSPPEQALVEDFNEHQRSAIQHVPGLPGEELARQIGLLERQAREVREGRAMGLAGLGMMSNGIIILSAVGQIEFANAAVQNFLELNAPTDVFQSLQQLQPPLGSSWLDIARAAVFEQRSTSFEATTGSQKPVFVAVEPLATATAEYAEYWIISLSDLSAIQEARAQREEALAFLSHDIRSPLLSVLAIIRSQEDQPAVLDTISNYTQKALSTSEQFLQLSRLQLQASFEKYDLELEHVLRNAIEQSYFLAKDKGMTLALHLSNDMPDDGLWMQGNGELLERAFVNLLSNAIKYSPQDSRVEVSLRHSTQLATITFQDHGYGIPEAEVAHIFDAYFRSQEDVLARNKGAGLGLRFVKTVVDRHGGQIEVDSRWGSGTCFTLSFPLLTSPPGDLLNSDQASITATTSSSST